MKDIFVLSYNGRPVGLYATGTETADQMAKTILSQTPFERADGIPPYPTLSRHIREKGYWAGVVTFDGDSRYWASARVDVLPMPDTLDATALLSALSKLKETANK